MKLKIVLILLISISFFWINNTFSANCDIDPGEEMDIKISLQWCLSESDLVSTKTNPDLKVTETWFKGVILWWIKSLSMFLAVWAVFWIAYWSLLLTLSWWEDEKIKKWKDLIKWSIIWFLWVAFAWTLISIVINFIYSLSP